MIYFRGGRDTLPLSPLFLLSRAWIPPNQLSIHGFSSPVFIACLHKSVQVTIVTIMLSKRICHFAASVLFIALSAVFLSAETGSIHTRAVTILFEKPLMPVAREIAETYPAVSSELSRMFRWEIDFSPEIVLAKDRDTFRTMVGSDSILAFAVPERNLIVLDTSRVYTKPFTLRTTLTHELCHLVLHRNIQGDRLPRWLDEGICQWASGGIAELMAEESDKALAQAAASDMLIPMRELERFPGRIHPFSSHMRRVKVLLNISSVSPGKKVFCRQWDI